MLQRAITLTAVVALGTAIAADAAAASSFPPRPSTAVFDVSASGSQTSSWTFSRLADVNDPCSGTAGGSGSQEVHFRTARGVRVQVMQTLGGEPWFLLSRGQAIPLAATFSRSAQISDSGPNDPARCKGVASGDGTAPKPQPDCGTRGGGTIGLSFGYTPAALAFVVDPGGPMTARPGQLLIDAPGALWGGEPLPAAYTACPFSPGVPAIAEQAGEGLRATGALAASRLFNRRVHRITVRASTRRERAGGEGSLHTVTSYSLTLTRVG